MKKAMCEYKLFGDSLLIEIPKEYEYQLFENGNKGLAAYDISTGSVITVNSVAIKERITDDNMIRDILVNLSKELEDFEIKGVYRRETEGGIIHAVVMTYKNEKGRMYAMNGYLFNGMSLVVISMATAGYYTHKMHPIFADIVKSVEYISRESA